jgi:HPt (histidine-containing phosphotransfer) domain-containing protein
MNVTESPLDPDRLRVLKDLENECGVPVIPDLAKSFLYASEETIELLKQAVAANNLTHIRNHAHKLKGSAGNMGAARLARICQDFEDFCQEGSTIDCQLLLHEMTEAHQQVKALLEQQYLENNSPTSMD